MQQGNLQETSSIELNQNTVIYQCDGLDSSSYYDDDSQSNQKSLSKSQLEQYILQRNNQPQAAPAPRQNIQQHRHYRSVSSRPSVKPIRDIEDRYDFDASNSTKEDSFANRPSQEPHRKSHQMNMYTGSYLPAIQADPHEQNSFSDDYSSSFDLQKSQNSIDHGRQAKLGNMSRKNDYKIDDFLNIDPVYPKGKKGSRQLKTPKQKPLPLQPRKQKYQQSPNPIISEEDTLQLITFPQEQIERQQKIDQVINKNERELQGMKTNWQQRFSSARLTFLDNFLPQPMKIKSNPYNLLKYINNRIRI